MSGARPPMHGRDHIPSGSDPIPGLLTEGTGGLHWGENIDDDSLGLILHTEQQDITIETTGADVGQLLELISGGQLQLTAGSQLLLVGDTAQLQGIVNIIITAPAVTTTSAVIDERFATGTDTWKVSDAGGTPLLEVTGAPTLKAAVALNMQSHKITNVTDPTSAQDAATKFYVDSATGSGGGVAGDTLWDAKGDLAVGSGADAADNLAVGSNDTVLTADSGQTLGVKWVKVGEGMLALTDVTTANVTSSAHGFAPKSPADSTKFLDGSATPAWDTVKDSDLSTSDITTNDVTTSKHGFVPKAPNDTAKFLRGDGTWNAATLPSGSAAMATDALWDAKGDLAAGTGADAAVRVAVGSNGKVLVADSTQTAGVKWAEAGLGGMALIFRYTVTGSDKASIDTGVDTPDAGSNDWTNCDLIEVFLYSRTDEAQTASNFQVVLNNDTTANIYKGSLMRAINAAASAANRNSSVMAGTTVGANATANAFGQARMVIHNPTGTVGFKTCEISYGAPDLTDAVVPETGIIGYRYGSTSAVTRLAVAVITAGKKLKVGTQLLIYKRVSA